MGATAPHHSHQHDQRPTVTFLLCRICPVASVPEAGGMSNPLRSVCAGGPCFSLQRPPVGKRQIPPVDRSKSVNLDYPLPEKLRARENHFRSARRIS